MIFYMSRMNVVISQPNCLELKCYKWGVKRLRVKISKKLVENVNFFWKVVNLPPLNTKLKNKNWFNFVSRQHYSSFKVFLCYFWKKPATACTLHPDSYIVIFLQRNILIFFLFIYQLQLNITLYIMSNL